MPALPLDWWEQFRLEERFGFNKSTLKLWISDKIKALILGFILGYPLICLLLSIFEKLPQTWWIWGISRFSTPDAGYLPDVDHAFI